MKFGQVGLSVRGTKIVKIVVVLFVVKRGDRNMIGMIVCWWTKEHDWSKWSGQRYSDGRTWYWMRICRRCKKIESVLEEPK